MAMDQPATTRNFTGTKNLITQDNIDDIEPEDDEYLEDATLDAERGRKNSLLMMENNF